MGLVLYKAGEIALGGIHKSSLIDYPGKVSCVLFVQGCNFRCPFCHNPELVIPSQSATRLDNDQVLEFLVQRQGYLDAVVISGGEPTLHPALLELCLRIKEMGYCVKLDTNGSRPDVLESLIQEQAVDYVAMDIKSALPDYIHFTRESHVADLIKASIEIIMEHCEDYEFRTTCVRTFVNPASIGNMARTIKGAKLYVLQPFRQEHVLRPEFFEHNPGLLTDSEIEELRVIAQSWVQRCIVR